MGVSFSATKLKVALKTAQQRMAMNLNKRTNAIRVESRVVATLLSQRKDESARLKVEGILHAKNLISVFETLSLMCELLSQRITLIEHCQNNTPPPQDLQESIASLIYCSSRVDVDELTVIAQQFAAKFGERAMRVHLQNEQLQVNPRIVEKLKIEAPPFELVLSEMRAIADSFEIDWQPELDLAAAQSGIRDSNPERMGAIVALPKGKEEEVVEDAMEKKEKPKAFPREVDDERVEEKSQHKQQPSASFTSTPPSAPFSASAAVPSSSFTSVPFTSSSLATMASTSSLLSPVSASATAAAAAKSSALPVFSPSPSPVSAPSFSSASSASSSSSSPSPTSYSSPLLDPKALYPGTLNILILQAKDLEAPMASNAEILCRLSESTTGLVWHSLAATWSSSSSPSSSASSASSSSDGSYLWKAQHCPIAVSRPDLMITVEVVARSDEGSSVSSTNLEVLGGLSIEAEHLRQSSAGLWYTLCAPQKMEKAVGKLLIATQFLPLSLAQNDGERAQVLPLKNTTSSTASSLTSSSASARAPLPSSLSPSSSDYSTLEPPAYSTPPVVPPKTYLDSDETQAAIVHFTPSDGVENEVEGAPRDSSDDALAARFRALQ